MNRPRYESEENLNEEERFCEILRKAKNVSLCKLSEMKYVIDFAVYDENRKVVGFIEFRRRYNKSNQYPDVFCSITKWQKLKTFSDYRWTAFFVQFDDKLMFICPNEKDYEITISGRTDRNDRFDMEPNVLLPIQDFTEFRLI